MRILELEISNIRGIRSHLFEFAGKSAVILGPNGAGKSAVIDSIEFLLTGSIGRLTGEGTGEISLSAHGPHVDSDASDAWVRAVVEVDNEDDPIEFKRCAETPGMIDVLTGSESVLEASLSAASQTQHVLTRRDLLGFVTADGSTRAKRIEALLDMTEIGAVRRALVKARNDLGRESDAAVSAQRAVEGRLASHVGIGAFDLSQTLAFTNEHRLTLGGSPIETLSSSAIRADLDPVTRPQESGIADDLTGALRAVTSVGEALEALPQLVEQRQVSLDELKRLMGDGGLGEIQQVSLVSEGLANLTGESCPLCGVEWDRDELRQQLEERKNALIAAGEALASARSICSSVADSLGVVSTGLGRVAATVAASDSDLGNQITAVEVVARGAEQASRIPVPEELADWDFPTGREIDTAKVSEVVALAEAACRARETSARDPRQDAWEALTQLEESVAIREDLAQRARGAAERKRQARILLDEFERARDATLEAIYDEIADRFRALYSALHAEEPEFSASLRPEEAALHLKVSFHGRGEHVPHALHSEGHQDSMGVCLFLALAERFGSGSLEVLLLDDVMMSVDAEHRRSLANLLAAEFGDIQLVVTTHDRQWAKQLQRAGIVTAKAIHEFRDWSIEAGPLVVGHQKDIDSARAELDSGRVNTAAHGVRRALEGAFLEICDDLAAPVPFTLSGRYELGDLLPSAVTRMRRLLKEGKKRANAHEQGAVVERISGIEDRLSDAASALQAEQWAVNPAVHYNTWENLAQDELEPVLDAAEELIRLFHCSACTGPLKVATTTGTDASVICSCGKSSWTI